MKYIIDIIETLKKSIDIEANNECEAKGKIESMYHNGQIILTADDFSDVNFEENFSSAIVRQIKKIN